MTTDNTPAAPAPAPASIHQAESLDALLLEADGLDAPAPAPGAPVTVAADAAHAKAVTEWLVTLKLVRNAVAVALSKRRRARISAERFKQIWDNDALMGIADPLAELCARHGLSMGQVMDRFGPWFALIAGIFGPGLDTWELLTEAQQAPEAQKVGGDGQQ